MCIRVHSWPQIRLGDDTIENMGLGHASRRSFLALLSTACLRAQKTTAKGQTFPSDSKRYADAATEFPVTRLTSPTYDSFLPAYQNYATLGRNTILFACDRGGAVDAYRLDLKSGEMRRLTDTSGLDPASLSVMPSQRSFCYCDGPALRVVSLSTLREREVYRTPTSWERQPGSCVSVDGTQAFLIERGAKYRLRTFSFPRMIPTTIIESADPISCPLPRPTKFQTLYRRTDGTVWLIGLDGRGNVQLKLPEGRIGPAYWSAEGKSLLYLHMPTQPGQLNTIREHFPESSEDKLIAKTTQFAQFSANPDGTVFTGASASKATPHVYILVRTVKRELTLCEHRAKDPASVTPIFAMNSQRVVFQSDQHGKPALYMLSVEKLVEETES